MIIVITEKKRGVEQKAEQDNKWDQKTAAISL